MSVAYNAILSTASAAIKLKARIGNRKGGRPDKLQRFAIGQLNIREALKREAESQTTDKRPRIWLHAASLGEYAIARPIIAELKKRGDYRIVMTFFSPSGYDPLSGTKHPEIDSLLYLPLDTKRNVRDFLNAVKPSMAVMMVSEYWYNYLRELHKRNIPTYLVSAKINADSVFTKWYGILHRRCLNWYKQIFVLNADSRDILEKIGCTNVTVSGNPLFDNAISKSLTPWSDPRIDKFADFGKKDIFIAGSVHDDMDIDLVTELANRHKDTKFIIVPHSIKEETIDRVCRHLSDKAVRLSQATPDAIDRCQSLIVDNIGSLAYIYRYGHYAYIGGGFTPFLHSLIEATVYGLPVSFGPVIHRKITPEQLIEIGIGRVVRNIDDLDKWFSEIKSNTSYLEETKEKAAEYIKLNANATVNIVNAMLQ